jgi:hypothetical protein
MTPIDFLIVGAICAVVLISVLVIRSTKGGTKDIRGRWR